MVTKKRVKKDGPKRAWDTAISGYPYDINGYDKYFHFQQNANVLLNTTCEVVDIDKKEVIINGEKKRFDVIVSTIGPDVLLNEEYGPLKYIGRES